MITVTLNICRLDMTETTACILDFANVEVQEVTDPYVPYCHFANVEGQEVTDLYVPYCRPRFEN